MDRNRRDVPGFEFDDLACMVRGSFPQPLVEALVAEVRRSVEAAGWDTPFSVWGVRWQDVPGSPFPRAGRMGAAELMRVCGGDDPVWDLIGQRLPAEWDAAILSLEGWDRSDVQTFVGGVTTDDPADSRIESRVFLYLSRSGDSFSLMLRYVSRDVEPEEVTGPCALAGVAGDVFRRYLGLPVDAGDHRVVELLGRLWLMHAAAAVVENPATSVEEALGSGDPVDAMLSWALHGALGDVGSVVPALDALVPVASSLRASAEGEALLGSLLEGLAAVDWRGARRAALEGAFPVEIDPEVVSWCDVGMFVKLVFDATVPQERVLDGLFLAGHASLAAALLVELRRRGWAEPQERDLLSGAALRPMPEDDCPCGAGGSYRSCHGRRLFP